MHVIFRSADGESHVARFEENCEMFVIYKAIWERFNLPISMQSFKIVRGGEEEFSSPVMLRKAGEMFQDGDVVHLVSRNIYPLENQLLSACDYEMVGPARHLIEAGCEIDSDLATPPIVRCNAEMLEMFVGCGADVNKSLPSSGHRTLHVFLNNFHRHRCEMAAIMFEGGGQLGDEPPVPMVNWHNIRLNHSSVWMLMIETGYEFEWSHDRAFVKMMAQLVKAHQFTEMLCGTALTEYFPSSRFAKHGGLLTEWW